MEYTNINAIADRLTRHPLMEDLPMEAIIDYTIEFIRVMGIPYTFMEKTEVIQIEDFRGELPADFYEMIQVRGCYGTYRYSTDSFHMSKDKSRKDLSYKLQGCCIFTSRDEDTVEISYRALPLDCDGNPLIPDNGSYVRALELYIKLKWFTIQFDLGKISPAVLQNTQREYHTAANSAYTGIIMPSLDQMESITRLWTKMLPDRPLDHETGYKTMSSRQFIKAH